MHLIIDNHTFDPSVSTSANVGPILIKEWKQLAEHYKNRSRYIYYEILNEPHGITNQLWGKIQGDVIDTIRTIDTTHTIVVGGADWNSYNDLTGLPHYSDNNLLYTFHFYDPMVFTHQGASWTSPSMVPLSGVPFPYDASQMPATPPSLKGTWVENSLKNYKTDGTVAHIKQLLDIAIQFKNQRKVPVFCGEFGVYMQNSSNKDRVYWYEQVRKYLEENGIPWTIWDYQGGFGVFKKGSQDRFDYDLNIPMIEALGLKVPAQK
jgi:endoglucanase